MSYRSPATCVTRLFLRAYYQRVLFNKGYLVQNALNNSLAPGLATRSSATGATCADFQGVNATFAAREVKLRDSINQRNRAFNLSHKNPTPLNRIRYLFARSDAQLQVRKAKSKWIMDKCNIVNNGFCGPKSSKASWDAVKLLKSGLIPSRRAPPPKLKRADGTFATTPEEVANVFSTHFSTLYGQCPSFDPYVPYYGY